MIKSLKLQLTGGEFEIVHNNSYTVSSDSIDHLVYEKDGVWYVISDPCKGKSGHTVISVPTDYEYNNIGIELCDAVLDVKTLCGCNVSLNINNSTVDIKNITAQTLEIKNIRSNIRINADTQLTDIDCGFGTVDIHLSQFGYEYKIHSQCGMGRVTHNSMLLPKHYTSLSGNRRVNVICGMGDVNIYT